MEYTVHGILQAKMLEWVAFPFSRGSSQSRGWTGVSHIAGRFFTSWATWLSSQAQTTDRLCHYRLVCIFWNFIQMDPFWVNFYIGCENKSQRIFFQNVCLVEVQKERKAEYGSFPLIFSFWMLLKVSEGFTPEAFILYLKKSWVISYVPHSSLTIFNIWSLP